MSIFQLANNRNGDMTVMRSWVNDMVTSAIDQRAATIQELTLMYSKSNIAFRASNKRGDAVSLVPMEILDAGKSPLPANDPLVKAFERNMRENMRRSEITLCWFGYNMLAKRRAYNGGVYRLQWVNPTMYTRDIRPDGLKGFRLNARREQIPENYLKKEDAVFQHEFDFNDDFGGVAPAHVALNAIEFGLEMNQTQRAFMQNGGAPAWVVSADPKAQVPALVPKDEDATALTKLIKTMFTGSRNVGRTLVQRAAWQWVQLTTDWDKIKFSEQYKDMYEAVAIAFDMPVEMITSNSSTYAEAKVMIYDWGHGWLVPRCNWYAEIYTEQLLQDPAILRRYGSGLTIKPKFDDVQMLQEDKNLTIDKINKQVQGGYRDLYTAAIETGVKEPPETLKGYYMWQGVPTPITAIDDLWKSKQPTIQGTATPVVPNQAQPSLSAGQSVTNPILPEAAKDALPPPVGRSICIMIGLPNDHELIGLQNRLKQLLPTTPVNWSNPADFHVTLVYAPAVPEDKINALKAALDTVTWVDDMKLPIGSVRSFDKLGEHAIHFSLRNNSDLNDLQSGLVELCQGLGIQVGTYSLPGNFKPHVTMGMSTQKPYAIIFQTKVSVTPQTFKMTVDKQSVYERAWTEGDKPTPPENKPEPLLTSKSDFLADDMFSELKVAARKGGTFTPDKLPAATVSYIKMLKGEGYEGDTLLTAAKSFTVSVLARKAVSSTQRDFEREFDTLMEAARADETTKRSASGKLRSLISQYVDRAFMDGLIDGGVDELSITDADKDALAKVKSDQSAYVSSFINDLFKAGISDDQAVYKASMWWSQSIYPAYLAGLESAAADNMFVWKIGATSKSCQTCLALNGQVHRYSDFKSTGFLPRSKGLICKGYLCDCDLVPTTGKAKGSLKSVPMAARSFPHDHEHVESVDEQPEPVV